MMKVVKASGRYRHHGKGGVKKSTEVAATGKSARFYPADDVPVPRKSSRGNHKVRALGWTSIPYLT